MDTKDTKGLFTRIEELDIEQLAEGLSEDEVCAYVFGIPFSKLPEHKKVEFTRLYTRGAVRLKIHAINNLKQQMSGRQGLQASLAVLLRFAEKWPTITDDKATNGQFNFRIIQDD